MTKVNKTQMQIGVGVMADCMDTQWVLMHSTSLSEEERRVSEAKYCGMIQMLTVLGGDYLRDDKGRHRLFLAGLSSRDTDEYEEEV